MQHLEMEELARLVDEAPTDQESWHLAECEECTARLRELCAQTESLGALSGPAAPNSSWAALEKRLHREGVMRNRTPVHARPWVQAAAAIAIFAGGILAGGRLADPPSGNLETTAVRPADAEEAAEFVRSAEQDYLNAIEQYSGIVEPEGAPDLINRLAALEGILLTTRSALREAPEDPIINNYHLTALGMRDALVRRLAGPESEVGVDAAEDEWF